MGAITSLCDPSPVVDPFLRNHDRPYFEYFGMNKFDVGPLVQLYNKMSRNKDGKVQVKTILKKFGIKRSLFMERAFSLLCLQSIKAKASLDYKTFIYVLWNFLTIGIDMPALAMSLYDIQRTNKLSREDVYDMMKDIHGWRLEQHLSELTRAIRGIEPRGLNLSDFQVFVLKNKIAFEPITQIMENMNAKTLGKSRWIAIARKRQERWDGKFVDLYDIMADMKEETGCPDNIISLDQFRIQIEKNLKYLADLEERKNAKNGKIAEAMTNEEEKDEGKKNDKTKGKSTGKEKDKKSKKSKKKDI